MSTPRPQLRHAQGLLREVDAFDPCPPLRDRLGKNATATTDVNHARIGERCDRGDPVEPERIDLVERFEFAFRIPPAMGEVAELGKLLRIDIHSCIQVAAAGDRTLIDFQ